MATTAGHAALGICCTSQNRHRAQQCRTKPQQGKTGLSKATKDRFQVRNQHAVLSMHGRQHALTIKRNHRLTYIAQLACCYRWCSQASEN